MPKSTKDFFKERKMRFREIYPEIYDAAEELCAHPTTPTRACNSIDRMYTFNPLDHPWEDMTEEEIRSLNGCGEACVKVVKFAQEIKKVRDPVMKTGENLYDAMKKFGVADKPIFGVCESVGEVGDEVCFIIDDNEKKKLLGYLNVRSLRMTYVSYDKKTGKRIVSHGKVER